MERATYDGSRCFVCGPHNPIGLRLTFEGRGDGVRTTFVPSPDHVGYDGIVHGGILAAVLDDAMANIFTVRGRVALVGRIECRFREQARPGEPLEVTARPVRTRGRIAHAEAALRRGDGTVVATASGTVVLDPPVDGP